MMLRKFPSSKIPLISSSFNIINPNQLKPLLPFSLPTDDPSQPTEPDPEPPQAPKSKRSAQLSRWSRARALRSGRRLERPTSRKDSNATTAPRPSSSASIELWPVQLDEKSDEEEGDVAGGKPIYMVSDGTGWTAEHSVNAALGQFEHCLVDRGCPVNTHLFSGVCRSFYSFSLFYPSVGPTYEIY